MRALVKTLFGDGRNLAAIAAILLLEAALAVSGGFGAAAYAVPVAVLGAVTWLARY